MFIELTTIIDGDEEKALFNIDHIVLVRQKNDHATLCFNQNNFTMLDVKESYQRVHSMIWDAIKASKR